MSRCVKCGKEGRWFGRRMRACSGDMTGVPVSETEFLPVCDGCWVMRHPFLIIEGVQYRVASMPEVVSTDEALRRIKEEKLDMRHEMEKHFIGEVQALLNIYSGKIPRDQVEALKYRFED